jgi:phosphinothricin acetyltransferase
VSIRLAKEADIPQILEIYRPYVEQTTVSFEYSAPSTEAFAARFQEITERFPFLVWEEDGSILGYAYACLPFSREAYRWIAEPSI